MSALISWCVSGATMVHQAGLRRPCLVTAFCFLLLRTATGPATHTAGLYSATAALTPLARLGSQIIPTWNQAAGIFLVYSGLVNALSLYLTIAMLDSVQLSLIMIIHLFVSISFYQKYQNRNLIKSKKILPQVIVNISAMA